MNKYKNIIHEYIHSKNNEIISELKEIVRRYNHGILRYTKELYERNGFETDLHEDRQYLLSYFGKGEKNIGIFSHADVVPVSDDWIMANPFEPIEKDGYLIGRGTLDDKSGVIMSLYCLKMLKDLDIPFNSRLVCFTGGNEESGMQDIINYLSDCKNTDFSIVPDTAFPLFRGNKGRISFSLKCRIPQNISVSGGTGATVIGEAYATLPFTEPLFNEISNYCTDRVSAEHDNKNITVKAVGIAKHSALPENSINAISLISETLKKCNSLSQTERTLFENLYNISAYNYGEFFGIENDDEDFGKLTCVLTKVETETDGILRADFNIRYGAATDRNTIISNITAKATADNWSNPYIERFSEPQLLPEDNIFVKRLLEVYKDYTGSADEISYVNAGGTYRQYLKNAVETGTTNIWGYPEGMPPGHGGAHQPDECININGFLEAIEINMLMILEIDKILEENE